MSCYQTIDSQGGITRHYTGDVTINLTSAGNGGANYVPPACSKRAATGVRELSTMVLLAIGLIALRMNRAYRRAIGS